MGPALWGACRTPNPPLFARAGCPPHDHKTSALHPNHEQLRNVISSMEDCVRTLFIISVQTYIALELESSEPNGFWKANRTRLIAVLLAVSILLNIASFVVIQPRLEATINNMMVKACESWLSHLSLIGWHLERAATNFDLLEPKSLARLLQSSDEIFPLGTSKEQPVGLYAIMDDTGFYLYEGLEKAFAGNQTGEILEQPLDSGIVVIIRDIAQTIDSLYDRTKLVLNANGVDPVRQFSEAEVLIELENYLHQINALGSELYNYEYP